MVGPVPGMSEHRLPMMVPRHIGKKACLKSFLLGRMSLKADIGIFDVDRRDLIDAVHELGDAEQAERERDQFDAVVELGHAERVALRAGLEVGADRAEEQAQHGHRHAFDRRAARQRRAGEQAEQHQRADFGRAELQRRPHQERRQEDHFGDAPGGADERGEHREAERDAAAALLGHREAVEAGHRMRWMAWQIEQDRADRAAILRAVHHAAEHQDGGDRLHAEGQRQQGSRWWRAGPCPAARRPCCRRARR